MREIFRHPLRRHGRLTGVVVAAVVSVGALAAGSAHADVFLQLPDGSKDGAGVRIDRVHERALLSPSMAANGAGRVVWVSGIVTADVTVTPEGEVGPTNGATGAPGTNNSSTSGQSRINTGYIVGCQVSIGSDAVGAGLSAGTSVQRGGSVSGSVGIQLAPGEVKLVAIDGKNIPAPGRYSIQYRDHELEIQGCAGYAQARSYTVVEIIGEHYSKTTLYGAPFSIG
ncbi:MspA family porin [Nocardia sp. NPDC003963]